MTMMKRIWAVLAVALLPLAAFGQLANRDILLTGDGTLYSVESVDTQTLKDPQTNSPRVLLLTIQKGTSTAVTIVPASMMGGWNIDPALAYDSESNTLFLFWELARNGGLATDLVFCSYQNGVWGFPTTLDSIDWDFRMNLRIGITRKTEYVDAAGTKTSVPEITVHAVWWQESALRRWARYAMLTTEKGNVTSIFVKNLADFVPPDRESTEALNSTNEFLRHPAILESPTHDTVDIVFGDEKAGRLHRLTLKPTLNGRLRIPIGVKDTPMPLPRADVYATNISAVAGAESLAFYFTTNQALQYVVFKKGSWSPLTSVALTEKIARETAVDALQRMVSSQ